MKYIVDTNVLVEAHRFYYAHDIAPSFWDWLTHMNDAGSIYSVPAVKNELGGGDWLADWVRRRKSSFWITETAATVTAIRDCVAWADSESQFTDAALAEFEASADLRLVAEARASQALLVTREVSDPRSKKRVKMPNAAQAVGASCASPFTMFRQLGLTFRTSPESSGQLDLG
ncbi:DUF4411 family protein [Arthrobacter castelli]|uniref:DUF4411 family protein n=1 Tax=Arthrobacter castelli TaxID=271431 RepID=UPI00041BE1EC|nr:DUF4411 family protein [Arthrobacter castelli]